MRSRTSPRPTDSEIDFLLDTINTALRTPLTRADLLGTYSGLRPLLDTGGDSTADISRKHAVLTAPDGLVTVVGGKLTTYRRMAQDALDAAVRAAGLPRSSLRHRAPAAGRARRADLDPSDRLVRRYGTEAPVVGGRSRRCSCRWPRAWTRRWPSCTSGSPTRARWTRRTCSSGAPGWPVAGGCCGRDAGGHSGAGATPRRLGPAPARGRPASRPVPAGRRGGAAGRAGSAASGRRVRPANR